VDAIVDLYQAQCRLKQNSNPHPRNECTAVKDILETLKLNNNSHKKKNYIDRGIGTILDGYNTDQQLLSIVDYFFKKNSSAGLRNRLSHLQSHFCLLRGENGRELEFADMFCLEFENQGPSTCMVLVIIMGTGKTNQYGRVEYGASMRHKNAELCTLGATGLYILQRFMVDEEEFLDLSESKKWYDVKVLLFLKPVVSWWNKR
jgi:hypothetical protein